MPKRKCKAMHDGVKCGVRFEPAQPYTQWCSDDCQVVLAMEKLAKVRLQQERARNKAVKTAAKKEREKHAKRKQEIKPLSWFHRKAQVACNAYIRERDKNDCCISCDKPLAFEEKYDAGHFKTQGGHIWIAYDEVNINGQCVSCNQHKSGNEAAQRPRLVAKWGVDEVERLEQSGKNLGDKSYTRDDLLAIEEKYKKKLKELCGLK